MIQTVIFDLGRTLVPFSFESLEPRLRGCRAAAEALFLQAETGALDAAQLQSALCHLTGISPADFPAWWNSIFSPGWLIPPAWIRGLMGSYRVGLLSNTNATHFEFLLRQRPLLQEFDFQIVSHQVGAIKPDPRMYAAAEAQAQCPPEAIFYLDDISAFVEAGRRRGWQAHPFTNIAALAPLLPALGFPAAPDTW